MFYKQLRLISNKIWFMVSEKKYYVVHVTVLHSVGTCMYQKSHQTRHAKDIMFQNFQNFSPQILRWLYRHEHIYIYTYRRKEFGLRNFKTFWKESYAIALDSCQLFTTKMLNMESNILIVLIEFVYIRNSLQQI